MNIGNNKKLKQLRICFVNGTLIIFGIAVGLFCIEFGLTLSGKILLNWQNYQYSSISKKHFYPVKVKKSFKILCLGDSSTYGSGVEISYSYPFQLLKLLNQQSPLFELTVISTGGINTSQIANRYEDFLKTDSYDLVIFQAGVNDVHRLKESRVPIYTKYNNLRWVIDSKLFNLIKMLFSDKKHQVADIDFRQARKYGIGAYLFLDRSNLKKIFRYNLDKIVKISKKNNISLWVQDYHSSGWMRPEVVLYEVYKELGLKVIHQKEIFDYAQGIRLRGNDGWHPNCYGYFVIARLLYNEMVDYGIVQGEKYDLNLEMDRIHDYIKAKKEGYQYIRDDGSKFDENSFIKTLSNIGIGFDKTEVDVGKFRIKGIFDFMDKSR